MLCGLFFLDLPHAVLFVYNSSQVTRSHCHDDDNNGGHPVDDITTGSFGGGVLQVAEVGLAAAAEEVGPGLFALTGILAPT